MRHFFATIISTFALILPKHLPDELSENDLDILDSTHRESILHAKHKPLAVMQVLTSRIQLLRVEGKRH